MSARTDRVEPIASPRTAAETRADIRGKTIERDPSGGPWEQRTRVAVLISLAGLVVVLLHLTPLGGLLKDFHRLRTLLDEGDVWAELVFVPLVALGVAVGTPRLIFYGLGGVAFGFGKGLLLAQVGTLAGAYATYLFVRWAGRDWINAWLTRHPSAGKVLAAPPSIWSVLMARQLPIGGLVINVGLGCSAVAPRHFLVGSFFGFLPAGVVATLIGSGLVEDRAWESVGQLLVAAILVLLSAVWLGRKAVSKTKHRAMLGVCLWIIAIVGAVVSTYALRLSGPLDFEGYAQNRNVGYIMDAAWQGNWIVQHDIQNRVTSKPPLHTWFAAILAKTWGMNRLTLTLPSFVSVLALSLLVFGVGQRRFGRTAGGFAGLAMAMAPLVSKHVALVRTDALFALAVTVAALAAWRAWNRSGGWTLFWGAAAAATLVKGPLGLVLGAAGLLAFFWERHTRLDTVRPQGPHWVGVTLYLAICLGWLLLALYTCGYEVVDKMLVQELFGQATGVYKNTVPGQNVLKPSLYLLSRFAPFSVFAFLGLWRTVRNPAEQTAQRRFERFLVCWMVAGMAIFSLAAHHRADLLLPLWPAGALLAGREIARLREPLGERLLGGCAAVACIILVGLAWWTYHRMPARRADVARYSEQVRQAACALHDAGVDPAALTHIHTPVTLQFYLQTYKPWTDANEVRETLTQGRPLLIVTDTPEEHEDLLDALGGAHIEELYRWPQEQEGPREGGFNLAVIEAFPEV